MDLALLRRRAYIVILTGMLLLWVGCLWAAVDRFAALAACQVVDAKVAGCQPFSNLLNLVGGSIGAALTSALGAFLGLAVVWGKQTAQSIRDQMDDVLVNYLLVGAVILFVSLVVVIGVVGWVLMNAPVPGADERLPPLLLNAVMTFLGLGTAVVASVLAMRK